ncbi:type II toxin-antitoxin system VapB family antitoxin [uncultured Selenomonas sp.]|mgnify:FL=1|uniref:type II toxin-antitoxin system VapB family antitoxin n=1 Tax=uncultured Selenomonas sp. TaxID=159275 RepID=UPI0025F2534D|nr:type II toxin-antitoxin system VapB family antitoxin [uncultured Selenomonas sp.]
MATNLALDDRLLNQAVEIGGLKTKKATVTLALKEFIQRRKVESLIDAFGTVDFDETYDYKAERNRHAEISG